ncbi:hypothetical protein [Alkalilacustris brevis]|uniref:hypothetical protein n=1 Tax=Alkalilacustris brevis TaxID=2026338 RepID=UPI0013901DF1|nr:hypothetical protein [Alkalilacustris brevis]
MLDIDDHMHQQPLLTGLRLPGGHFGKAERYTRIRNVVHVFHNLLKTVTVTKTYGRMWPLLSALFRLYFGDSLNGPREVRRQH